MTASTKGILLVKADRINTRLDDYSKFFLKLEVNKESISRDDFKEFIKAIHIIVDTELTEKGVERKWKSSTCMSAKRKTGKK